jgi:uncharacterized protein (DUF849 family)
VQAVEKSSLHTIEREVSMNTSAILTCAITGAGNTVDKSPHVPVTPQDIADSALEAAKAGAAIVHIHVRDPQTGQGARDFALYEEVVTRIRESKQDVIINLTAGMGADFIPSNEDPGQAGEGSDMADAHARVAHVLDLRPELCTLDCGSMNYADSAYVATPEQLRVMAGLISEAGVKPEIECFELGHIWMAQTLIQEGLIPSPPMFQLCMGIPFGAPATPENLLTMRNNLPRDAVWAAFAIGRLQMPFVAQSALMGGHVRVGLEDNLYLSKGVQATNAQLVDKASRILSDLGGKVAGPAEARDILGLVA